MFSLFYLEKSEFGVEMEIAQNKNLDCFQKIKKLFPIKVRNDHSFFALIYRDMGTNYSDKERVLLFIMYCFIVLFISAMFYNTDYDHVSYHLFCMIPCQLMTQLKTISNFVIFKFCFCVHNIVENRQIGNKKIIENG